MAHQQKTRPHNCSPRVLTPVVHRHTTTRPTTNGHIQRPEYINTTPSSSSRPLVSHLPPHRNFCCCHRPSLIMVHPTATPLLCMHTGACVHVPETDWRATNNGLTVSLGTVSVTSVGKSPSALGASSSCFDICSDWADDTEMLRRESSLLTISTPSRPNQRFTTFWRWCNNQTQSRQRQRLCQIQPPLQHQTPPSPPSQLHTHTPATAKGPKTGTTS